MATATLTFDLNDPDDKVAHLQCVKAVDILSALWDIQIDLKDECLYYAKQHPKITKPDLIHYIWERISDECLHRNVDLNELYQ